MDDERRPNPGHGPASSFTATGSFEPMTMTGIIYLSISLPSALATKALERRLGTV